MAIEPQVSIYASTDPDVVIGMSRGAAHDLAVMMHLVGERLSPKLEPLLRILDSKLVGAKRDELRRNTPGRLDSSAQKTVPRSRGVMSSEAVADVVADLQDIDVSDPEAAHCRADSILLVSVPEEVHRAYVAVQGRCRWWADA